MSGIVDRMPNPVGRPPRFKKAGELWEIFKNYCHWVDDNPWQIKSGSSSIDDRGKDAKNNYLRQDVRPVQRAYTLYGFCAFAGINYKWADFKKKYIMRQGFESVIMQIENVVIAQQIDGALIHQFDGSIVARLNGFTDKQSIEITGDKFKWPKLSNEDIEYLKEANGL